MKKKTKMKNKKIKKVKAWAVHNGWEIQRVFTAKRWAENEAKTYKYPVEILPCEISYSLPIKPKAVKRK